MKPQKKQLQDPRSGEPGDAFGGNEDPNYSDPAEWDWENMYHEHLKSERAREEHEKSEKHHKSWDDVAKNKERPF